MSAKADTKNLILKAAGLLFAEHGYRHVTTRMIAQSAKISHGLLHYHFRSKKSIYFEVVKLVYETRESLTYQQLLETEPHVLESETTKAYIVYRLVMDYFRRYVFFNEPWKLHLIQREILNPSPVYACIFKEIFISRWNHLAEFYYLVKPDAKASEAFYWSHYPDTQGFYYHHLSIWWDTVLQEHDDRLLEELRRLMIGSTSRAMIIMLNLPVPEFLRPPK